MADHAPRPCCHPGCGRLVSNGSYCAQHQVLADQRRAEQLKKANKRYNPRRADSDKFYDTAAWRRFRRYYLITHPLCVDCEAEGLVVPAVVVDHIKPFKERPDLALDETNMRGLCRPHDNRRRHDRRGRD
ncbi:HNH endonuclease [Pseudomonas sp. 32.2.56]|uniref:HNH endonuclease signature motif containing protein n=1 Tax=Pseudomonas sp. 32.2.56 TaxID=2969303 RepID=UPI00214F9D38|nr:HNH endonuclease signature motif containing protein [Pseudomonas sp. 32.2.56]MCR4508918.1 HNH endonuclease [Pseudomonas sp. 32.2.56]